MKKLVYSMLLSSLAVVLVNAHEIWLELDEKKNEAKLFFGHFDGKQTESGEKFARIKEGVSYPTQLVKDVKRDDNSITYTLSKKSDIAVVRASEPRKARIVQERHKYGISKEDISYSKCLLCGETSNLHIDHCHNTKKFRGLLCGNCNTGIGMFKENIEAMEKAIQYIKYFSNPNNQGFKDLPHFQL